MNIEVNKVSGEQDKTLSVSLEKPWVVLRHGTEAQWITHGPYSSEDVKMGLKTGEIKPTDYCWLSGWSDWKRIYLEPEFYLARKPPIEIKSKITAEPQTIKLEESLDDFAELAHKTSPEQYKGWKYKKKYSSDLVKASVYTRESQVSKDGEPNMLEPWEDKKTKSLDFVEEKSLKPQTEALSATVENYIPEDFDVVAKPFVEKKSRFSILRLLLLVCMVGILALASYRLYNIIQTQDAINYSMSYFVVEDYASELPEYLYARTDLKKGEQIKIRVFDLADKQIKTRNSKAGLMLTSQGTGRMRLPLYTYSLATGAYKILIEVDGQKIEKEFSILPEG